LRNYWMLVLVAMLVVGTLAVGCGGGSSPIPPPPTSGVDGGDDGLADNGVSGAPESLAKGWIDFGAFVRLVASAEWQTGEEIQYAYNSSETLNGIATEKVSLTIFEDGEMVEAMTMWVDRDGNIVQAVIDGQAVEDFELKYIQMFAIPPLIPFYATDDPSLMLEFTEVLAGKSVSGWDVSNQGRSKETIGGKSVDVYTLDVKTAEHWGEGATMRFSYGDFGSFKMLLGWDSLDGSIDDFFETGKIIFR
jgi:hypothetical protein